MAAKGELNILAAGAPAALDKVRPALEVISKRIWNMGEAPPTAHAAKIACNMMIAMAIEAMAEAVVLTEANGVARERFFDVILNTLFGSRAYQVYSTNILHDHLPMLDAVHRRMAEAVNADGGDKDWSVMADYTIRSAGGSGA